MSEKEQLRPMPEAVKPNAIIVWHNIHVLQKIVSIFSKDAFVQLECVHGHVYVYGRLQAGIDILCFYEVRLPHCVVKEQNVDYYAIFSAKTLTKAIKSFTKATTHRVNHIEMHLTTEAILLFGNQDHLTLSESNIKAIVEDSEPKFTSVQLKANFGWEWEVTIQLDPGDFTTGLISLDAKEHTQIVLENNQLYFACKDEDECAGQKQFVPITGTQTTDAFSGFFAHAGMTAMQKFVAFVAKTDTNEEETKDDVPKTSDNTKQKSTKQPDKQKRVKTTHKTSLTVKMDSTHPMQLVSEQADCTCKLFIPGQEVDSSI